MTSLVFFDFLIGIIIILFGVTMISKCGEQIDKKIKLDNCLESRLNETTNEYECLKF